MMGDLEEVVFVDLSTPCNGFKLKANIDAEPGKLSTPCNGFSSVSRSLPSVGVTVTFNSM